MNLRQAVAAGTLALLAAVSAAGRTGFAADAGLAAGRLPALERPPPLAPPSLPLVPRRPPADEGIVRYLPLDHLLPPDDGDGKPRKTAAVIQIMILLTVLALAPSILIMLTGFLRIVIVMGFVRKALSTQTLPPDQVLVGLSLLLTFFIMWPTWQESWSGGWMPYWNGDPVVVAEGQAPRRMDQEEAFAAIMRPQRAFMFRCLMENRGREELFFFMGLYENRRFTPEQAEALVPAQVPLVALVPAFVTSELRRAFFLGFLLYLPFLVLDMVIASVLMSMGMMMLQPAMISLPFKLILFVMVDGWRLLMEGLVTSFPAEVFQRALEASG